MTSTVPSTSDAVPSTTDGPVPRDRFERWQPRNWSLALKLVAVLLVPTLLGVSLGVARIVEHTREAGRLAAVDRVVGLESQVSTAVRTLQDERDQAAIFVQNNRGGDRDALRTLSGATDDQVDKLLAAADQPGAVSGGSGTALAQLRDNLARLGPLRAQVTGTGIQAPGVVAAYTGMIQSALVLDAAVSRQLSSPGLAGASGALTALASAKEQVSLEQVVIGVAIARGEMQPADAGTVIGADAQLGAATAQFRAALTAEQQDRYAGFTRDPANTTRQQLKQTALSRVGAKGQLGITPADWDRVSRATLQQMRQSSDGLRDALSAASKADQEAARNQAGIDSVILLLALLAAAAVVFLVGRSILKPLRTLRGTALDIAERRLPRAVEGMRAGQVPDVVVTPVPVTTTEEIGQVARAFDQVHGQAVRLAAEQATLQTNISSMFVNLSRRSQGLVERQLRLIEQLERNEQDAEQLDNLFQLDHLATRMRRNSENLLVLAGSELGKRGGAPIPLVDVLRAAVSEIEQYQRVVVQQPPRVNVVGRTANDMVHLVAELLDNATAFSAPDTQVVISSTRTATGGVLVEIADQGVGMPGQDLIAANNRLAEPIDVDVSTSRRMGLVVVGRLAGKHGVNVRLAGTDQSRGTSGGVTASVSIPPLLIADDQTARPGVDTGPATGSQPVPQVPRVGLEPSTSSNGTILNGSGLNGFGVPSTTPSEPFPVVAGRGGRSRGESNGRAVGVPEPPPADALPRRTPGGGRSANGAPANASTGTATTGHATTVNGARGNGPAGNGPAGNGARGNGTAGNGAWGNGTGGNGGRGNGTAGGPPGSRAGTGPGTTPDGSAGTFPRRRPGEALGSPRDRTGGDPAERSAPRRSQPASAVGNGAVNGSAGHRPAGPGTNGSVPEGRQGTADRQGPGMPPGRGERVPEVGVADTGPRDELADTGPYTPVGEAYGPPDVGGGAAGRHLDRREDQHRGQGHDTGGHPVSLGRGGADDDPPTAEHSAVEDEPMTGYGEPRYAERSYPEQDQGRRDHDERDHHQRDHDERDHHQRDHDERDHHQRDYGEQDHDQGVHGERGYEEPEYDQGAYGEPEYDQAAYGEPRYDQGAYGEPEYDQAAHGERDHDQRGHPRRGYGEQSHGQDDGASHPAAGAPVTGPSRRLPQPPYLRGGRPTGAPVDHRAARSGNGNGTSERRTGPESPIFEEMASAWFRDAPERAGGAVRDASGPGDRGAADPEWNAGEPLLRPMEEPAEAAELTTAGLPRRRPRSQLIPGGSAESSVPAAGRPPARSAEQVRGRLASYQQGIRQGRESRHRLAEPELDPTSENYQEDES